MATAAVDIYLLKQILLESEESTAQHSKLKTLDFQSLICQLFLTQGRLWT